MRLLTVLSIFKVGQSLPFRRSIKSSIVLQSFGFHVWISKSSRLQLNDLATSSKKSSKLFLFPNDVSLRKNKKFCSQEDFFAQRECNKNEPSFAICSLPYAVNEPLLGTSD